MQKRRWVFDLEASGLLDHTSINYLSVPFKLKDTFSVWCAVFIDEVTGATVKLRPHELDKIKSLLACAESLTGHNIISYDLMVLKLYFGIDYFINEYDYKKCWVGGHTMEVVDTLIMSQYLQPDRLGGHSLKAWGIRLGILKGTYGEENEEAWAEYSEDMLDYCEQDVKVNVAIAEALWKEWGDWDHAKAFSMEQAINEIVVRQEHIGFHFDRQKAQAALDDLNEKLDTIERDVEPLLPKVKLAKTNAAKYTLPARQVKQDGTLTKHMENWVANHNAECEQDEYGDWIVKAYGQTMVLPHVSTEPLVTHAPMTLSDQKQMKQYLVHLGWTPTVWGSRDLTLKSGTKIKVGFGKYKEAVLRYCQETAKSHFKEYRLAEHKVKSVQDLYTKLMEANIKRPVYVLTSPKYTIDQEKTICPNLLRLGKQVAWVEKVVQWLTYRHRRNMLLSPNGTGLMTHPRLDIDSRIPTGAVVTGTNTYRFKHRGCVNIPRPSSIYGAEIRELFGCGEGFYQIGCDAASLEGRVQGHYCYPYTDGIALAKTLIAEKPNDIHTVRAKSLGISRDDAKAIGYACVTPDTLVMCDGGNVKIDKIQVGDYVWGWNSLLGDSQRTLVTNKTPYFEREIWEVTTSRGVIRASADHRWLVNEAAVETQHLEVGTRLDGGGTKVLSIKNTGKVDLVVCIETETGNFYTPYGLTGNCLYGAQVAKLQSMLGCTKQEAERVFKEFWESTPALHELKARVEMFWDKNGKTFLKGIDGRKVNTRSKHSLLNALFQSAGIILMKWAAIILDRKLEKDGLLFKPFDSDTWEGKCAQMQHYHDEYQFKVDKSLVHTDDNNALTSPISDYLEKAIGEAGIHLSMRVAFAGEAMIGTNWRECH